ncbi:MAG: hypothetical protein ACXQTS_02710 [Candidatus Methanospirareceae archaeon]
MNMEGEEKEQIERLKKRIGHWAEHNKEHIESFKKAAEEARRSGFEEVSNLLKDATRRMEEANSCLLEAMKELETRAKKES